VSGLALSQAIKAIAAVLCFFHLSSSLFRCATQ
jgi:hypothetical protein